MGMEFTMITYDQEIYEIGFALRMQCMEQYSNVVLHLGGFHQWINIMKATMKIWKGYRAEDCIAMAIAHKVASYKIFSEKGDYYQIPTSI